MKTQTFALKSLTVALAIACATNAFAAPAGAAVVAGAATIATTGKTTAITAGDKAIINWQGFSIGKDEVVKFLQPSSTSSVLNRVIGSDPSVILGQLQANGRVFLINANGILFGQGAQVNVGGLVASTLNISNEDFIAGKGNFSGSSTAKVVNQAFIETASGGRVVLMGKSVENSGLIHTPGGEIWLAAGSSVTLMDSSTQGTSITINAADGVSLNLGQMIAERGVIGLFGNQIRNEGVIQANGLESRGGKIFLMAQGANSRIVTTATSQISANGDGANDGGKVIVKADGASYIAGKISANGGAGGNGGFVETSGGYINVDGVQVSASGQKSGTWLIDPNDIEIIESGVQTIVSGGSSGTDTFNPDGANSTIRASTIESSLNAGLNVIVDTASAGGEAGNITVNAAISKTTGSDASLTLNANGGITINESISSTSGAMAVTLNTNQATPGAGMGDVAINAQVATNGGSFTVNNAHDIALNADVQTAGGNVALTGRGTVDIASTINAGAGLVAATTAGDINLLAGGSIVSTAAGNAATLTAGGVFKDLYSGGIQLSGPAAYWLVYSADHASVQRGNLVGGNLFNCATPGACDAAAITDLGLSGNRFVFQSQPTLTVTVQEGQGRVYDGTSIDSALIFDVTGYVPSTDTMSDALSGSFVRAEGSNAGSYAYSAGSLKSTLGYKIQLDTSDAYTITPRSITVTAGDQTKVYGNVDPTLTYSVSNLVNGDTLSGTLDRMAGENVGSYTIGQGSLSAGSNYTTTYVGANLVVTPATLTVKTTDATTPFGTPATLSAVITGYKFADNESVVSGLNVNAGGAVNAGTYVVSASGATAQNYVFDYQNTGVLTIEPPVVVPPVVVPPVVVTPAPTLAPVQLAEAQQSVVAVMTTVSATTDAAADEKKQADQAEQGSSAQATAPSTTQDNGLHQCISR